MLAQQGTEELVSACVETPPLGARLKVRLEDSAVGTFVQADTGVHIARRIVEAHRRRIRVEDAPGGGSSFVCTEPRS